MAVQISGTFGSRQEEAQRLGRVLRPKADGRQAHFYTVIARDTLDAEYAAHRQRFLAEQGYAYTIVDADDLLRPLLMDQPAPDTKDWTWVIHDRCPECGFDAAEVERDDVPDLTRDYAAVLADGGPAPRRERPARAVDLGGARVRLPRPRRVQHLRARLRADARRGRPAVRQLGPGRDRAGRRYWAQGPRPGRGPARRRRRHDRGRVRRRPRGAVAAAGAPLERLARSPSTRSPGTSCTTWPTTPGTCRRARPRAERRTPSAPGGGKQGGMSTRRCWAALALLAAVVTSACTRRRPRRAARPPPPRA